MSNHISKCTGEQRQNRAAAVMQLYIATMCMKQCYDNVKSLVM